MVDNERCARATLSLPLRRLASTLLVLGVLAWPSLSRETRQKLFWDNASRFYKQT